MKKKKMTVAVISAVLVLTAALCIVPALAKYITRQGKQSELVSDSFYFTSDYLRADETPEYTVIGDSITFEIRNYADSLRINGSDIPYTVAADAGSLDRSGGTLTGGTVGSDSITLSHSFSGAEEQKEITVSVIGTGDYTETLQAKFIFIRPTEGLKYEVKDSAGSNYAVLYIYATDADRTAELSWNTDELLIDETNDYVFGGVTNNLSLHTGSATTKTIVAGTAAKIVFFKKNISEDYTHAVTVSADGTIHIP